MLLGEQWPIQSGVDGGITSLNARQPLSLLCTEEQEYLSTMRGAPAGMK